MKHNHILSNLVINTKNRTLANQDEKQVTLRPLSYEVLQVLIKNDGHAVSREELFAQCWMGSPVSDQALTNVISNIRQTLLRLRANGIEVHTVNKVGYRLSITEPQHPTLVEKFSANDAEDKTHPLEKAVQKEVPEQLTCDTVTQSNWDSQDANNKDSQDKDPSQIEELKHTRAQTDAPSLWQGVKNSISVVIEKWSNSNMDNNQKAGVFQTLGFIVAMSLLVVTAYYSWVGQSDDDLAQQHFQKLTNSNQTLYVNDESEYLLALQILTNAIYAGELLETECPVSLLIQLYESTTYANQYSLSAQIFDRGDLDDLKFSYSSLSQNELVPAINTMIKNSLSLCSY
ncbi:winged helix-turn-helix domain-containing protein [Vibrio sp. D404a]|uniref:winged helix-turn-helix domain-containing protein n=1 Tax=unclassified Vibrio TaxID=2614977 RepID=UPI002555C2AC|nr:MULTISPECIES: winged helix-turn-helix domain-containing protein [unclassified Vibrio]MDK9738239.1 winged helix-turn-helix domain-containing protein [Vibrio sp. D404a]MDK9796530.1 winged helix-turn-helix domain-containing protein [Vibrio sp. D449a]